MTVITPANSPSKHQPPIGTSRNDSKIKVKCKVKCRIPSSHSNISQFYLFLFEEMSNDDDDEILITSDSQGNHRRNSSSSNNASILDNRTHLAIVFGQNIDSQSLHLPVDAHETEMDRLVRGCNSRSTSSSNSTVKSTDGILVRIHSACFTGETLLSARCDCGQQLEHAMEIMASSSSSNGIIVYLNQEGRGIGLEDKLKAYNLQDMGHDTVSANLMLNHPPDARDYRVAASILEDLLASSGNGCDKNNDISVRLLTNNPDKIEQLEKCGIKVVERIPILSCYQQQQQQSAVVTNSSSSSDTFSSSSSSSAWSLQSSLPSRSDKTQSSAGFQQKRPISSELMAYLHAKVDRMRHLIDIPPSAASTRIN